MKSITDLQNYFQDSIDAFQMHDEPKNLNSPVNYIMGLGGKRIRPIFVLAACEAFNGNIKRALDPAMAIEVFHNFTLMHDDIMDEAPLRRGKSTTHMKYDTNTAILSGDVMLIYAYKLLEKLEGSLFMKIFNIFNHTAVQVCEGQRLDLNFETQDKVEIDEYIKMIEYKTAVLLGCSLKVGAYLGNANDSDANNMYDFGRNLGIAFQIQDDILDTYGDQGEFGKKIGGDIIQNKKTFLLIKALENANGSISETLNHYLSINDNDALKINGVIDVFDKLNVRKEAELAKQYYTNQAFDHLDKVRLDDESKSVLYALSDNLIKRIS